MYIICQWNSHHLTIFRNFRHKPRQLAQEHKYISTSFLQRRLRIGYPRAARIMEKLEQEGYKREPKE